MPHGFSLSLPWWGKPLSWNSWLNKFTYSVNPSCLSWSQVRGCQGGVPPFGMDEPGTEKCRSIPQLHYYDCPGWRNGLWEVCGLQNRRHGCYKQASTFFKLLFLTIYVSRTKAVHLYLILANCFPLVPPCGTSLLCLHSAVPHLFCHSSLSSHPLIFSLFQISLCWNYLYSP